MSNNEKSSDFTPENRSAFIRGILLTVVLVTLLTSMVTSIWWFLAYTEDDGRIYPNVIVYGTDLGGMTPEEAAAAIHALTDGTYPVQSMTIQLPDTTLTLSPADTGAAVDVNALVHLCYSYGRGGNRWENTQARGAAELVSYEPDVSACLTLDHTYIRETVEQAAAAAASSLTQSMVIVTGETPELNLTYEKALEQTDLTHMQMSITMGTPYRSLNVGALIQTIEDAYIANRFEPIIFEYDVTNPAPLDPAVLFSQHCHAPVDAVLNDKDYTITPEVLGYGFDTEALTAQLATLGGGQSITVDYAYIPAARTAEAIDKELFHDILGAVSTTHTNNSNRNTNLRLACQALNGKIVLPGETVSYNETLGERTTEKGYKPAGAYIGGKTVDTVGGGICQVSSSLYYACLKADLEIVQRYCHGYTVSYVPYGMDATVSWGTLDFKFRNNTEHPIRIEAGVYDGQVHIKLVGHDTRDYYVKMTYETIEGPTEGEVVYEDYPYNNPEGYKDGDVIQTPYTGRTVKSYRCKYSKETNELISTTYEATSRYSSRDEIIARVEPAPTESTEPAESAVSEEDTTVEGGD